MNTGAFALRTDPNELSADAVEAARMSGIRSERARQARVYFVAIEALRVLSDDARALGNRLDTDDQKVAHRIASTIDGVMDSLRDMKPRAA